MPFKKHKPEEIIGKLRAARPLLDKQRLEGAGLGRRGCVGYVAGRLKCHNGASEQSLWLVT